MLIFRMSYEATCRELWVFNSCKNSIIFIMGSKKTLVSNFRYLNLKNVGCHVFASVLGTNSLAFAKCFYWMFEWHQYKNAKLYYPCKYLHSIYVHHWFKLYLVPRYCRKHTMAQLLSNTSSLSSASPSEASRWNSAVSLFFMRASWLCHMAQILECFPVVYSCLIVIPHPPSKFLIGS